MADRSAIEWTDATWNPVRGCARVSAGCQHCYAERVAARFCRPGQPYEGLIHPSTRGWNGKVRLVPEVLDQPLRWRRPRRIFVNSMSDLFHEDVPDEFIAGVWCTMRYAQEHTFQILTKRPERMLRWLQRCGNGENLGWITHDGTAPESYGGSGRIVGEARRWPLTNVWLGVSVEDQAAADERIPLLLQCPAAVRWVSAEPLLGRVDLCEHLGMWWNSTMQCFEGTGMHINLHNDGRPRIGWVVAGGESGPGARPMHPSWARSLRDQCAAAGVPFLFKQWGEWLPVDADGDKPVVAQDGSGRTFPGSTAIDTRFGLFDLVARVGKKTAGRLLDGRLHDEYPEVRHAHQ